MRHSEPSSKDNPILSNTPQRLIIPQAGEQLDPPLREFLESKFGCSLERVRIHTGKYASTAAQVLGVEAFTIGTDIYFADGCYDPQKREGLWLLVHELTHVIQQNAPYSAPRHLISYDSSSLEFAANTAADLIAANRNLPADFAFGRAPTGEIQCHHGPPCPGTPIGAGDRMVWGPANDAIEAAYKNDPTTGSENALFFGSQFETGRDVLPPAGTHNKRFATILLQRLRGLVHQRRPDIIDFQKRVFYEIKTVGYARSGNVQKESYYVIADEIRREYAPDQPPWADYAATWYPPHVIPFPSDPLNKIVCTQATDHRLYPGLILYEVRHVPRR